MGQVASQDQARQDQAHADWLRKQDDPNISPAEKQDAYELYRFASEGPLWRFSDYQATKNDPTDPDGPLRQRLGDLQSQLNDKQAQLRRIEHRIQDVEDELNRGLPLLATLRRTLELKGL